MNYIDTPMLGHINSISRLFIFILFQSKININLISKDGYIIFKCVS